jgi:hypothetical protein
MKTRHAHNALVSATLTALLAACGCSSTADYSPPVTGAGGGGGGAAGGRGGGGGAAGAPASSCGDTSGPVDPTALIDDMEATDPLTLMIGGRNGAWWAGGDPTSPGASIVPNGDASAEPIPGGGRCGSLHAMHVTGQGFTVWADLSVSMRYGSVDGGAPGLLPYDAHIRTGLTFWARIGDTSAAQVRLAVTDKYTRPEGGICDAAVSSGANACYDNFGVDLTPIGKTWTQYRIPFAGLSQRNFGLQEPSGVDTSAIYTIEFDFYPNEVFDFWVDDISFY